MEPQKQSTIFIGTKGRKLKNVVAFFAILSLIFSIFASLGLSRYTNLSPLLLLAFSSILYALIFLLLSSFFSVYIRYFEISDTHIILCDSTQFIRQFQMLSNLLFHTHYEAETARIELKNIRSCKLYAIKDQRLTRTSGYDNTTDTGYRVWLRFDLKDDSKITIKDWFYYKNPEFLKGLEFLRKKQIPIIDHQHIEEVIKSDISLVDYLNGKVSL